MVGHANCSGHWNELSYLETNCSLNLFSRVQQSRPVQHICTCQKQFYNDLFIRVEEALTLSYPAIRGLRQGAGFDDGARDGVRVLELPLILPMEGNVSSLRLN